MVLEFKIIADAIAASVLMLVGLNLRSLNGLAVSGTQQRRMDICRLMRANTYLKLEAKRVSCAGGMRKTLLQVTFQLQYIT